MSVSDQLFQKGSRKTQNNIERSHREAVEREMVRAQRILEKLPSVERAPENLFLSELSKRSNDISSAWSFKLSSEDRLQGLVIFYEDGTADITIYRLYKGEASYIGTNQCPRLMRREVLSAVEKDGSTTLSFNNANGLYGCIKAADIVKAHFFL